MKTKYKLYSILFGIIFIFNSCELTESIENINPLFLQTAEEGIIDESSAQLALIGAYSTFRQDATRGFPDLFIFPSKMGIAAANTPASIRSNEEIGFATNNYSPNDATVSLGAYTKLYTLINRTNWIIEKVPTLSDAVFSSIQRRSEIVAEAKALRALGHFYLLRLYGQFYDVNSEYGINLRITPARSGQAFPRNTVSECYTQIIKDIDDAIAEGPTLGERFFVNKTFAKALKAKVLLYQGNFSQSASQAKEVLDMAGGNLGLSNSYSSLFDHTSETLFQNSGLLFATKGTPKEGIGLGNSWFSHARLSDEYLSLANTGSIIINGQKIEYDGNRVSSHAVQGIPVPGFGLHSSKFASLSPGFEMIYHLRLAEVYLIYAEAEARANNSVTTSALNALNKVRIRAGALTSGNDGFETYTASISLQQFLEVVRIEKLIELGCEMGEDWFDLIRYDFADGFESGFSVSDIKATATNTNRYILPIPAQTISAGNNIINQNPGY